MKTLGVLGGLGPMASAYFLQLITQMSEARTDQEHMEVILHSKPQIPDRTQFILGRSGDNPVPQMVLAGRGLAAQGAELLAIPCVTAHFFQKQLKAEIGIPILNAIEETAIYLKQAKVACAGVLATDGTLSSGLFQSSLSRHGIGCIIPEAQEQRMVMQLIYDDVKAGKPVELPLFAAVSERLFAQGVQVILLACTELSLIKRDHPLGAGYLDVLEVLARQAVLRCGRLKQEYESLITR
ncbi:MAG: amino acid racemase [bacterium]|nr:amino acid racemase [bacterium]MCM1376562.1 amino acid racemase [Muribaculum sp.]